MEKLKDNTEILDVEYLIKYDYNYAEYIEALSE